MSSTTTNVNLCWQQHSRTNGTVSNTVEKIPIVFMNRIDCFEVVSVIWESLRGNSDVQRSLPRRLSGCPNLRDLDIGSECFSGETRKTAEPGDTQAKGLTQIEMD